MSELFALHRLEDAARALQTRTLVHGEADWLATVIKCGLKMGCFDHLIIRPNPNSRKPSTTLARERRDRHMRSAAALFYGGLSTAGQAEKLHIELKNYSAIGWLRDVRAGKCSAPAGTLRALLWSILSELDYVPAAGSIRRILAAS